MADLPLPSARGPRFVLLERRVPFVVGGGPTGGASERDMFNLKAMETALEAMKPDLDVVEPPGVSRLYMMQQIQGVPAGDGFISSTDKNLIVLYAGQYRPGCSYTPWSGCYIVYDASINSVSAVPKIPPSPYFSSFGRATAILSRGRGTYVLAEIGTDADDEGTLYLWQCTSPNQPQSQWNRRSVRLPPEVRDNPDFSIDMTFSYRESSVCWVNLLQGVIVCDLVKAIEGEPELTFIPLPHGYYIDTHTEPRPRPHPEHFRTMGCVNGLVKFVALDGLYENHFASNNVTVQSWTLSSDLKEWKLSCNPLAVKDIWASESFRNSSLPRIAPVFPILSCNEDEVVYLSLKEVESKNIFDRYARFEARKVVTKAYHVLRVDIKRNKVLHCARITQGALVTSWWPAMLATDFSSYLYTSMDHEGARETTVAGTSKKHVKH